MSRPAEQLWDGPAPGSGPPLALLTTPAPCVPAEPLSTLRPAGAQSHPPPAARCGTRHGSQQGQAPVWASASLQIASAARPLHRQHPLATPSASPRRCTMLQGSSGESRVRCRQKAVYSLPEPQTLLASCGQPCLPARRPCTPHGSVTLPVHRYINGPFDTGGEPSLPAGRLLTAGNGHHQYLPMRKLGSPTGIPFQQMERACRPAPSAGGALTPNDLPGCRPLHRAAAERLRYAVL